MSEGRSAPDCAVFTLTRPRRHEESSIQRAVATFLRWSLPENATFFAIPNGGYRWRNEAARLVGEGMRAGMPDLCVLSEGTPIFLELKTDVGRLSAVQRQMMQKLEDCGAEVFVCRSLEDAARVLSECGVRLRGKLG